MHHGKSAIGLSLAAALLGGGFSQAAEPGKAAAAPKLVDINSASRAELKTLPGIGDAEAKRIIAARPYPSKAKLVADKVLSIEAYEALRGRIVANQKEPSQPRKP
jgi:competence protein ComEA